MSTNLDVAYIWTKAHISTEQVVQRAVERSALLENAQMRERSRQIELDDVDAGFVADAYAGVCAVRQLLFGPFETQAKQFGRHVQIVADGQFPDVAADGRRQALPPQLSRLAPLLGRVPLRQDLQRPDLGRLSNLFFQLTGFFFQFGRLLH